MKHLVDFSTLRSAAKGLGTYGFPDYLNEAGGTEGLSQLLDLARLIDIYMLSDEILVSERVSQIDIPMDIAQAVHFVPLEKSSSYFNDLEVYADDFENLKRALISMEGLLGSKVTQDFLNEIENELTEEDYQYVDTLANKLSAFASIPIIRLITQRNRDICKLAARTFQYLQTADLKSVPYVCHTYRSPLVRTFHPRLTKTAPDLYAECESKLRQWLIENVGSDRFEFQLPMFFLAVLRDTKRPDDLFRTASQLRNSNEVVRLRKLLSEVVDGNNRLRPLRYLELRRIASEQAEHFKKRYTPGQDQQAQELVSAELSIVPTSITAKASVDLLKASKKLVRLITEWNDRRGIAVIFKTARNTYAVSSLEDDIKQIWGVKLTERHKDLLRQIAQHCDA